MQRCILQYPIEDDDNDGGGLYGHRANIVTVNFIYLKKKNILNPMPNRDIMFLCFLIWLLLFPNEGRVTIHSLFFPFFFYCQFDVLF